MRIINIWNTPTADWLQDSVNGEYRRNTREWHFLYKNNLVPTDWWKICLVGLMDCLLYSKCLRYLRKVTISFQMLQLQSGQSAPGPSPEFRVPNVFYYSTKILPARPNPECQLYWQNITILICCYPVRGNLGCRARYYILFCSTITIWLYYRWSSHCRSILYSFFVVSYQS